MILTPGPVEVSSEVLSASQKHMPHRSEEFREILRKSLQILRDTTKCQRVAITAGSGKLGAGIFTFLVPTIISTSGFPVLFDLLAGIAFAGVILTLIAIRETKNMSLEQASSLNVDQGASRHPL